jgi:superfamily II DNA or RNA helicase
MAVTFNKSLRTVPAQVALAHEVFSNPETNFVLVAPTGSGKTEIAYMIAAAKRNRGKKFRTLVLEPNQRLVAQTWERAKKYGLLECMSVAINPTAAAVHDLGAGGREVYSKSRLGGYLRKDWASRKERGINKDIRSWREPMFVEEKRRAYSSNVMISTYQLIKSDLERASERGITDKLLNAFDTIIVDEVPDFVAYGDTTEEPGADEQVKFRISKYYQALLNRVGERPQIIGLTAFPGRKTTALEKILDGRTIKPEFDDISNFIPDVNVHTSRIEDDLVTSIYQGMENSLIAKKAAFVRFLKSRKMNYEIESLGVAALSSLAGSNDEETARNAASILKHYHTMQMMLESSYHFFTATVGGEGRERPMTEYLEKNSGVPRSRIEEEVKARASSGKNLGKIDALIEILGRKHTHALVTANYVEPVMTANRILEHFGVKSDVMVGGEVQDQDNHMKTMESFNNGHIEVLLTDYGAGGHGIDLWGGTSVVYLGLPATREKAIQAQGRITRKRDIPQFPKQIDIHTLVYSGTSDEALSENVGSFDYSEWPGTAVRFDDAMIKALGIF